MARWSDRVSGQRRSRRDEAGAVAVLFGILAVLLFVMAGLVVDLGQARDVRRQSQNAADASALAAGTQLYPADNTCTLDAPAAPPCYQDAIKAATDYAAANFSTTAADWTGCTDAAHYYVVSGQTPCVSFTDSTLTAAQVAQPTRVRVAMPLRKVVTAFGTLAGTKEVPVGSQARAALTDGPARTCGMCFLGDIDAGNADFTVNPGSILVNGDLSSGPNGSWTAGSIGVSGTVSGGTFTPAWTPTQPFTDPLASLVMPSWNLLQVKVDPCSSGVLGGPGVYLSLQLPNGPCTLQPGLYVVIGDWGMKNNSVLNGTGVTIYVTCALNGLPRVCNNPLELGGSLDFKNGTVNLSAPTTGATAGQAILYDRRNSANLGLQGNGGTSITGTVYAKSGKLDFNGNSCFGIKNGPVVVKGVVKANGNKSCVTVSQSTDASVTTPFATSTLDQ